MVQEKVLNALKGKGELSTDEIQVLTGLKKHSVGQALRTLFKHGYVSKQYRDHYAYFRLREE